ncbi:winged helix-turn-helix domain-containing protein [Haladaptatus sp. F3-133]|uniref:Winged helix-turn-helix domain-containing protein n=1 Tax=Halorutilus salinus TaxID=2487751 RepID=A0A9Q4C6J3_9EURY|nr:winged helix-turn-helix domain-containing protein [Halorutilus salinus]MCX2819324.1 winged helix-turn-helix domain-containing protein [Halorutilus salinus]
MDKLIALCRRHEYLDAVNPKPKSKSEVADSLNKSVSTARKHLKELEGQGIVKKTEGDTCSRSSARRCVQN